MRNRDDATGLLGTTTRSPYAACERIMPADPLIPMGAVAFAAVLSAIAGWMATKNIESLESVNS